MRMNPAEALSREKKKKKAAWYLEKENLYAFAEDLCGYDRLIPKFHGPICDWMADVYDDQFVFWTAARGHYKTTLQIADLVQDILRDPTKTHLWIHAVLSEAVKSAKEIAWHFQKNPAIKEYWPEHCAPLSRKTFFKSSKEGTAQFTLVSQEGSRNRQPTLLACGMGKEITGAHISGTVRMDDIIGKETIAETGGLRKVEDYWAHTIIPVMDPGCKARNTGTRWDAADIYGKWIHSDDWKTIVRAVFETDGVPDWKGKNVGVLSSKELAVRRREMGPMFGPQMMNDPAPIEERIWNQSECEHPRITQRQMRQGPGKIILLGDPAPLNVGSPSFKKEMERGDLSKDYWAWCVVRIRRNGSRQEILLLDGTFSRLWDEDCGMDEGVRLAKKWGATHAGIESAGGLGGAYQAAWKRACQRGGARAAWLDLKSTKKADAKNYRVASLASRARQLEFLIVEGCPQMFLDAFFEQVRPYRKTAPGRNNLQHDDVVDVVSYATDPAIDEVAPAPFANEHYEDPDDLSFLEGYNHGPGSYITY